MFVVYFLNVVFRSLISCLLFVVCCLLFVVLCFVFLFCDICVLFVGRWLSVMVRCLFI